MKRIYNILLHLAFWILFAIMPLSTVFFSSEPLPLHSVVYIISVYLLHVINFYIGYFLLLPLLLRKKKIILTIFGYINLIII